MTSTNFAAAQQRIANRRQQRLAAQQAHTHHQQETLPPSLFSGLPAPLRDLTASIIVRSAPGLGRHGTNPTFRVGQVDAELLDEELLALLKGQVGEALKYYGAHLRDDWDQEILLALRSVLFKLTVWDHDASYGAALQNLRYTDARDKSLRQVAPKKWQKILYGIFSVGGRYAWQKWEDYLLDAESSYEYEPSPRLQLVSRLSTLASTTHSAAAFTSFLIFLLNGRYRTILDRVLRLRLMPTASQVSREVSFEYLNRQLVWHAFTEFLLFLLPLVGISRWRRWLARAWRKARTFISRPGTDDRSDEIARTKGELGFLPERTCAVCYQDQNPSTTSENEVAAISASATSGVIGSAQTDITNPYEGLPCGCVYCFVCLAQRLEGEDGEGWVCLRCGEIIKECRPWSGDVVTSEEKKVRKRVSFLEDHVDKGDEKSNQSYGNSSKSIDSMAVADEATTDLKRLIEVDAEKTPSRTLDESAEWAQVEFDTPITARARKDMTKANGQDGHQLLREEQIASLAILNGDENEAESDSWDHPFE